MASIKIGDMYKKLAKELGDYGVAVALKADHAAKKIAAETAQELQSTSPKRTGKYAGSWTYGPGETGRTKNSQIIYADEPGYRLAHLLEKGHQKRDGGRTEAIVHIAPAEEEAVNKLMEEIKRSL